MGQAESAEIVQQSAEISERKTTDEFRLVPLEKIVEWKEPRDFSHEDVAKMVSSLRTTGQVHPLTIEPFNEEEGTFTGVTGKLRFEAARSCGISELTCRVKHFRCESERLEYQLAENIARKDFTTIEKADRFRKLYEAMKKELGGVKDKSIAFGISQSVQEASGEEGPSEQAVYKYLKVSRLPGGVKAKIGTSSKFGLRHALELSRLNDKPEVQLDLAEKFLQKPMTTQQLKQQVDRELGINPREEKVQKCPLCDSTLPSEDFKTFKVCGMCSAEFQIWLQERKENLQNSADLSLQKPIEPSPAEATQQIMCQTCRVSLLLAHNADGTHKILVKQRKV